MRFIKKFENFQINEAEAPTAPTTKPVVKPGKPAVKPNRPSPIRRDKPSVSPKPKALKKATAEEVAERFISELGKNGDSVENYL